MRDKRAGWAKIHNFCIKGHGCRVKPKPPITTPQQMQQSMQQRDQAIETAMLTALQRDTALLGRLKGVTNFNQADKLVQTLLSLTKIPSQQIKSGLASLSRMGVQTQAGR